MCKPRSGVKRIARLCLPVLLACVAGCRSAPIRDVIDAPLPEAWSRLTLAQADEAIWRAGRKVGWEIERLSAGVLRGTWRYKHYSAVTTITHDLRKLSIRYEESDHLLRNGEIHSNYNVMVGRLLDQIRRERVADGAPAGAAVPGGTPGGS